jgi:hypothetical protein
MQVHSECTGCSRTFWDYDKFLYEKREIRMSKLSNKEKSKKFSDLIRKYEYDSMPCCVAIILGDADVTENIL